MPLGFYGRLPLCIPVATQGVVHALHLQRQGNPNAQLPLMLTRRPRPGLAEGTRKLTICSRHCPSTVRMSRT